VAVHRDLFLTQEAIGQLEALERDPSRAPLLAQVRKTLALLETDIRHPSLRTHEYRSLRGPKGDKVFEAYFQQNTPGAYRVFFIYGPDLQEGGKKRPGLTVITILPHP
jgi:hypothetical protein